MPEPAEKNEEDDPYSLDTPTGFDIEEKHPTILQKFAFICIPVPIAFILAGGFSAHWNMGDQFSCHNWCGEVGVAITCMKHAGHLGYTVPIYGCLGGTPQSWCIRILCNFFAWTALTWPLMYVAHSALDMNRNHHTGGQDNDVVIDGAGATLSVLCGFGCAWSMWLSETFAERTAWGVYCCASFPKMIVWRNCFLAAFLTYLDWYVGSFLFSFGRMNFEGGELAPMGVFAWKRVKFIVMVLISIDDNPVKMWCYFPTSLYIMLRLNGPVAQAMVGVQNAEDIITYVVVDTLQFLGRNILLARWGMNTCPKLFTYILQKQLQNVVSPLPKVRDANGPKTAMRTSQALMVLLEGETLTSNFLYLFCYFFMWGTIMQSNYARQIVPFNSFWVIGMFFGIDLIQDLVASKVTDKFSNWTYIYSGNGWAHPRHRWQSWNLTACWIYHQISNGGYMCKNAIFDNHKMLQIPAFYMWHTTTAAFVHA